MSRKKQRFEQKGTHNEHKEGSYCAEKVGSFRDPEKGAPFCFFGLVLSTGADYYEKRQQDLSSKLPAVREASRQFAKVKLGRIWQCHFSRMRSEGFSFISGGLGVARSCSRVRNRSQPFVVRQ